jgi:hypothetical protein
MAEWLYSCPGFKSTRFWVRVQRSAIFPEGFVELLLFFKEDTENKPKIRICSLSRWIFCLIHWQEICHSIHVTCSKECNVRSPVVCVNCKGIVCWKPYTLMTHIANIFIKKEFLLQTFGLCHTATTLDLQTCLYTCFGTCVILLYSSSVSCGWKPISGVPIAVNNGNPLYVLHSFALKNVFYLYDNQQMPIYKYVESHNIIVHRYIYVSPVTINMVPYNRNTISAKIILRLSTIKPRDIAVCFRAALKHTKKGIHSFVLIYDLGLRYACT